MPLALQFTFVKDSRAPLLQINTLFWAAFHQRISFFTNSLKTKQGQACRQAQSGEQLHSSFDGSSLTAPVLNKRAENPSCPFPPVPRSLFPFPVFLSPFDRAASETWVMGGEEKTVELGTVWEKVDYSCGKSELVFDISQIVSFQNLFRHLSFIMKNSMKTLTVLGEYFGILPQLGWKWW